MKDKLKEAGINLVIFLLLMWSILGVGDNLLSVAMFDIPIKSVLWECIIYIANAAVLVLFWYMALIHFVEKDIESIQSKEKKLLTPEQKKINAYHEAGHAVICKEYGMEIDEMSILPDSECMGYIICESKYSNNDIICKTDFMNYLTMLFAGREAERYIFNENSSGCIKDFEKATEIARNMVTLYGMTTNVISFRNLDSEEIQEFGPNICNKIGGQIEDLLYEAKLKAEEIIKTNKELLEKIAQALIEKEQLSKEELEEIFEDED